MARFPGARCLSNGSGLWGCVLWGSSTSTGSRHRLFVCLLVCLCLVLFAFLGLQCLPGTAGRIQWHFIPGEEKVCGVFHSHSAWKPSKLTQDGLKTESSQCWKSEGQEEVGSRASPVCSSEIAHGSCRPQSTDCRFTDEPSLRLLFCTWAVRVCPFLRS